MNEIKLRNDRALLYFIFSICVLALTTRLGYFFSGNQRAISNLFFVIILPIVFFIFNDELKIKKIKIVFFLLFLTVLIFFWNLNLQYLYSFPDSSYYKSNPFLFNIKVLNNFLYLTSIYIIFSFLFKNIRDYNKLWRKFRRFLLPCLIILSVEFYIRIFNPTLINLNTYVLNKVQGTNISNLNVDNFYSFKFASIMFGDSNFIPLFLAPLFILFCIKKNKDRYDKFILLLMFFFVVFSFSRAGIASFILIFLICRYMSTKKLLNWVFKSIFYVMIFSTIGIVAYNTILNDPSFMTKIKIFDDLLTVFDKPITVALFGFGPSIGGFEYSYGVGYYAHTLLAILLGEIGILGIIIYLSFYIIVMCKNRFNFIFLIPLFTMGFSYYEPWEGLIIFSILFFNYLYINKETIFN
ncbi:TPA: hypothetical protein ACX6Q3_003187 [Photobacterium damselae]